MKLREKGNMRKPRKDTIRSLYRAGIIQYFGCGDKKLDRDLIKSTKKDVHIAGKAPGQWVSDEGVLEIYCESGIPNASDIYEIPPMPELGFMKGSCVYNSDRWCKLDEWVNLGLKARGYSECVRHEPYNGGVIGVFWDY
tara:strand:- start:242 stop:658 length:417 start_codon:yes stop_codon:yes gene_type:complete